ALQRRLALRPDDLDAYEGLTALLFRYGRLDDAVQIAESSVERPALRCNSAAWRLLGRTASRAGDADVASNALAQATELDPQSAQNAALRAQLNLANGQLDAAQSWAIAAVTRAPTVTDFRLLLADILVAHSRMEDALGAYRSTLALPRTRESQWRDLARALIA